EATQNGTGCIATTTVTITSNIVVPTVNASVTNNVTNCTSPNGSVTASASGSPGPFTFYWFNGNVGVPDTTASNFKGATYLNRPAGFYTVVAVDRLTRCATQKATVEVLDQKVLPVIA